MSRQKSNRTLLLEQERAARRAERARKKEEKIQEGLIRLERRARKAAKKGAKRIEREKRKAIHESIVRNGMPKVQPSEAGFGLREAMAYSPLVFCESCNHAIRESEMVGDICEQCYHSIEGRVNDDKDEGLKAHGDKAPHSRGERETKPDALAGQLKLI